MFRHKSRFYVFFILFILSGSVCAQGDDDDYPEPPPAASIDCYPGIALLTTIGLGFIILLGGKKSNCSS